MVAATIIDLDEVELQFLEVVVGIHLFISVEAHIRVSSVAIADTAASAVSCITVNACFQPFGVDVVAHDLQSMREALWMDSHFSCAGTAILEAVVDVNVLVADIFQSLRYHSVGLTLNDVFRDVDREGVPRTPAHSGGLDLCIHAED